METYTKTQVEEILNSHLSNYINMIHSKLFELDAKILKKLIEYERENFSSELCKLLKIN